MGNGSGVSRGDRNRNARLGRLRALVPFVNVIVGIDLAGKKQMVVVTDHDSKVLARKTFRCHAWDLGAALDWASKQAAAKAFAGVTVACEPTGHRWRVSYADESALDLVDEGGARVRRRGRDRPTRLRGVAT
jgi:transposase